MPRNSRNIDSFDLRELFCIPPTARAILRGHIKIAVITYTRTFLGKQLYKRPRGIRRDYYQDRVEMYQVFDSVFQVCTEKITVYRINLLQVQKNWFVILFQVDSIYIQRSKKKLEQVRRREVASSV